MSYLIKLDSPGVDISFKNYSSPNEINFSVGSDFFEIFSQMGGGIFGDKVFRRRRRERLQSDIEICNP